MHGVYIFMTSGNNTNIQRDMLPLHPVSHPVLQWYVFPQGMCALDHISPLFPQTDIIAILGSTNIHDIYMFLWVNC